MKFTVLTLFPEIFDGFLESSILGRARRSGRVAVELVQLRDFATDRHRSCDDYPYGGGAGMVLRPEPLAAALSSLDAAHRWTVYLSPGGRLLNQAIVQDYAQRESVLLIAGRYEGIDQRIIDAYVDEELSIGDYVLGGGEVPAMVVIEAVARVVDGVINRESLRDESFADNLLEYPHYTRPEEFDGQRVPEVLLSGNHARIDEWRHRQRLLKTRCRRPDLLTTEEQT
ncbi:MAG: tRNA (guanosine(37)-N1)-methyltransferase TrmD [Spirochaetaceae bacterium]|nr:tRNA (guanosine(37)-N1)-methyltransferase TrmD [Spirochaetaceae bacterium]